MGYNGETPLLKNSSQWALQLQFFFFSNPSSLCGNPRVGALLAYSRVSLAPKLKTFCPLPCALVALLRF
jgi:hypothetical protein